jgi:hypothetical protein
MNKITAREVIKRFTVLKSAARRLEVTTEYEGIRGDREVDLHVAALEYAAAWTKVARADRK